jgi:hypothetical protein
MSARRYRRHPNVRVTALENEGVALHLDSHKYYTLNVTGLTLLDALAEPRTIDELGAALTAQYDVSSEDAERTARAFVEQCVARGVVVLVDG